MKWLAEAVLLSAVAFLKSIPAIGVAPWACALVDALFLVLLLTCAQRGRGRTVFTAAILMPVFDWLQGAIPGYWVLFIGLGCYAAANIWERTDARRAMKVVLSVLAAYLLRVCGVAFGYIFLKDMGLWSALRSVVRNSWFVFAWYAAAVALYALIDARKKNAEK